MMDMRGWLYDIVKDVRKNVFRITFEVEQIPSGIDNYRDKDLSLSVKQFRNKRSLTANAYYWVLVAKIADAIKQPQSVVHNVLLRRYGVVDIVGGETMTVFIPDTEEAENEVLKRENYHLRPTSNVIEGKNGKMRAYRIMLGSSYYDTKQFSTLLDGAISEAKEIGLETLPNDEVERMMEDYAEHYEYRQR